MEMLINTQAALSPAASVLQSFTNGIIYNGAVL